MTLDQFQCRKTSSSTVLSARYVCGSARKFIADDKSEIDSISMTCQWNKTWTPGGKNFHFPILSKLKGSRCKKSKRKSHQAGLCTFGLSKSTSEVNL